MVVFIIHWSASLERRRLIIHFFSLLISHFCLNDHFRSGSLLLNTERQLIGIEDYCDSFCCETYKPTGLIDRKFLKW